MSMNVVIDIGIQWQEALTGMREPYKESAACAGAAEANANQIEEDEDQGLLVSLFLVSLIVSVDSQRCFSSRDLTLFRWEFVDGNQAWEEGDTGRIRSGSGEWRTESTNDGDLAHDTMLTQRHDLIFGSSSTSVCAWSAGYLVFY